MAFVIRQMSVLSHESDIFGGLRAVHSHGNEWFHRKAMHPCDRRHIVLTDGYAGFIVGRIGHVAGPRQRIHDNARGINEVAMNFRYGNSMLEQDLHDENGKASLRASVGSSGKITGDAVIIT